MTIPQHRQTDKRWRIDFLSRYFSLVGKVTSIAHRLFGWKIEWESGRQWGGYGKLTGEAKIMNSTGGLA
ncbi:MAG: hypothetical protein HY789_09525 [Deltaproteobacteria bacterium]|nr:hypothetical protein [Deltaproteobacteria bacterium]